MTLNTRTFDTSLQQDVLVVTPNGDSLSYRDIDIQREGAEIKDYILKTGTKQVVVDMGRSNYFGSLMIGVINSIGQSARQNNGHMAICNASEEMRNILDVMKLDTLWPLLPTLPDAIKVVKAWKD